MSNPVPDIVSNLRKLVEFKYFNEDADRELTIEELNTCLTESLINGATDVPDWMVFSLLELLPVGFRLSDLDGNGKLSHLEFDSCLHEILSLFEKKNDWFYTEEVEGVDYSKFLCPPVKIGQKFESFSRNYFIKDTDHVIDVSSFDSMFPVFHHFDEDADGTLTVEEFITCFNESMTNGAFYVPNVPKQLSRFSYVLKAFKYFDRNGDGKVTMEEFAKCLNCLGIHVDDDKMKELYMVDGSRKDQNKNYVMVDWECYDISKTRDIFLALTGQAGVAFYALARSPPLNVIMSVNAFAFLSLSVSSCLAGSKHKVAEKITGTIGIAAAVVEFFLMTGLFFA